jgi:hypothetical protein
VIGSAAVGALVTAAAGSGPGLVLGLFVVAGTVAAALAVQPGAVYRIIPVPALSYLVAALLAGMVHDRANGTSSTALAVGAAQWIASGFLAMTAATILAIVITAARWPGRSPGPRDPGDRPPAAGAGRSRRRQSARNSPSVRSRPHETDDRAVATIQQRRDGIRDA